MDLRMWKSLSTRFSMRTRNSGTLLLITCKAQGNNEIPIIHFPGCIIGLKIGRFGHFY
jgi:hypothetical protein